MRLETKEEAQLRVWKMNGVLPSNRNVWMGTHFINVCVWACVVAVVALV
jgi:hypothetical protein